MKQARDAAVTDSATVLCRAGLQPASPAGGPGRAEPAGGRLQPLAALLAPLTGRKCQRVKTRLLAALCLLPFAAANTGAYDLGTVVADMRQGAARSGPTSCPQYTRFDVSTPGAINRQWSTALGASPVTILTANQTTAGRLNEIESTIQTSLAAWTGVSGALLKPSSLGTLQRTPIEAACSSSDGVNSICFDQNDPGFTLGVLAFTRVVSANTIGEQLTPATPPATFIGEILDADVLVAPASASVAFATPAALAANPTAYDLESILTHELGHSFGFNHSGAWNAMMFPYAPPAGQFTAPRPTPQAPDAPLSDDDRTGLRILYPDPSDSVHMGAISGHVLPANPLALPLSPDGVTGIFPAQVVAFDNATGAVTAAVFAGWSCTDPGPAQFDGTYSLQHLAVGSAQAYQVYAEPLDGAVVLGSVIPSLTSLCRNAATDPGWPAQYACVVPPSAAPFSTVFTQGLSAAAAVERKEKSPAEPTGLCHFGGIATGPTAPSCLPTTSASEVSATRC